MPLQLTESRRREIGPGVVGCRTVKRHKCRAPLTHYKVGQRVPPVPKVVWIHSFDQSETEGEVLHSIQI